MRWNCPLVGRQEVLCEKDFMPVQACCNKTDLLLRIPGLVVREILGPIPGGIRQHLVARTFDFSFGQQSEILWQRIAIEFCQYPVDQFRQSLVVDRNLGCARHSYNIRATRRLGNQTTNDVMQCRYLWRVACSIRQVTAATMQQVICPWIRPQR